MYLVVIDAYSKWLECILMNCGTSTNALICKLKYLFSKFGLPVVIVSDNDTKINSKEFNQFCSNNGIRYVTSPIYHPSSNGQAENSVKTCKKMLKCILEQNLSKEMVADKLLEFLFEYRNAIHCSTGETPAKLMLGRNLRSRLDLVLPDGGPVIEETKSILGKSRQFAVGDEVWLRWYIARKETWTTGTIIDVVGNRMFDVRVQGHDVVCRRHVDQLLRYSGGSIAREDEAGSSETSGGAAAASAPSPPPMPTASPPLPSPSPSQPHVDSSPDLDQGPILDRNDEGDDDKWAEAREDAEQESHGRADQAAGAAPAASPRELEDEPATAAPAAPAPASLISSRSRRNKKKVNYKDLS